MSWYARFFHWLGTPFRALVNPEGRRAWAVLIAFGCEVVMTAYATWALWLVKDRPSYVFWLGTQAMGLVLLMSTAFTGLLVKRDIGGSANLRSGQVDINIKQDGGENDAGDAHS